MVALRPFYTQALGVLQAAGVEDAAFELDVMVNAVTGKHRLQIEEVSSEEYAALQKMVARRIEREPLQYILNSWDFLGLRLAVGPGVLCPRPETEELCLQAASVLKEKTAQTVLDLCAGTGALAIGIQHLCQNATVTAVELYSDAFQYLTKNCEKYAQAHEKSPCAVQADVSVYHEVLPPKSVALLMANPPYLTCEEYEHLAPELYHEPRQALVAQENGLYFYRIIAENYKRALMPGAHIFFEIGATQAKPVTALLQENGYHHVSVQADFAGLPRVVQAVWPG